MKIANITNKAAKAELQFYRSQESSAGENSA